MPNRENIRRPITLVGAGRSGTTLLTDVFRAHPDCESLGETGDAIFSCYHHLQSTLPFCGPFFDAENASGLAREAVYASLLSFATSERARWFHKPIHVPKVHRLFDDTEVFLRWWWEAQRTLFPEALVFTVLRDPSDVVVSSMRRWNRSLERAVGELELLYRWLLHESSCCRFALRFEELVDEPERSVRALLGRVGLPFDERCLEACARMHAPNTVDGRRDTLAAAAGRGHAHREAAALDIGRRLPELHERALERLWTPLSATAGTGERAALS